MWLNLLPVIKFYYFFLLHLLLSITFSYSHKYIYLSTKKHNIFLDIKICPLSARQVFYPFSCPPKREHINIKFYFLTYNLSISAFPHPSPSPIHSPWKPHSILNRQSRDAFSAGIAHMKIYYADGEQEGNHFTYVK